MLKKNNLLVYVLVYVDDIPVIANSKAYLSYFVNKLNNLFSLKDLGANHYFLGIEVNRDSSGLYLNQGKYVLDLLQKFGMFDAAPMPTPMVTEKYISIYDGNPLPNPTVFQQAIGALQYLTTTRPDIAFQVNKLSWFLSKPTDIHFKVVKRILRYLKGTFQYSLHIKPSPGLNLIGFSNAD